MSIEPGKRAFERAFSYCTCPVFPPIHVCRNTLLHHKAKCHVRIAAFSNPCVNMTVALSD